MIDSFPEKGQNFPFRLYFDNLFTSQTLLVHLKDHGYGGTRTICENRLPQDCQIIPPNLMKERNRGDYDYKSSKESGVTIFRWRDNSVVTITSPCHGINPISSVNRYSRELNKKIAIPRPNRIDQYNKYMDGTDKMDQNVALYR